MSQRYLGVIPGLPGMRLYFGTGVVEFPQALRGLVDSVLDVDPLLYGAEALGTGCSAPNTIGVKGREDDEPAKRTIGVFGRGSFADAILDGSPGRNETIT